ncbi:glycosyltransferase family 2 protein [Egibacter rhizosphaerae]|uniref:Glycosyltransferase family 2 protein n=1 Tax=Egibacter rhizosphaerae TaxID=1670831 RepID=A0A411YHF4_9ACTN|nr:glycosyltransferase [Egibacter rhizosphaerae]QBI20694.1 glycosyltransferase family 2 protein [Egibacter rhizosphaerae]
MQAPQAYDAPPTACALGELLPRGPWRVVATSAASAQRLCAAIEEVEAAIGLDDPGWRARLRAVPATTGVLVFAGGGRTAATLDVLRLLRAHRAPVVLLPPPEPFGGTPDEPSSGPFGRAPDEPSPGPASGSEASLARMAGAPGPAGADQGHAVRIDLGGRVVAGFVRAPQPQPYAWAVDAVSRAARLAPQAPRLAAVGPAARAAARGWSRVVDRDADPRWAPDWGDRGWRRPDAVLLDDGHPDPALRAGTEHAAHSAAIPLLRIDERDEPVTFDPDRDRVAYRPASRPGRVTVWAGQPLPGGAEDWEALSVLAAGASDRAIAATVVQAAARGWIAAVDGDARWRAHVGERTLAALDAANRADLADADVRERASVRLGRVVHDEHHPAAALRARLATAGFEPEHPPAVSVLLATARPEFLDHAVRQVATQRYRPLQVVLVAHGPAAARAATEMDTSPLGDDIDLVVVEAAATEPLGATLNLGARAADGPVLSKMDDDDWYGPDHLADCVGALRTSGAPLAGKSAEFVYLAARDVTVRRAPGSDRFSDAVSGATLTLHRADLHALGGFAPHGRAVDRRLVEAVERTGERPYRTHALQFVVNRHGGHATWTAGTDYFLSRARAQWRGLARVAADLDPDRDPDLGPQRDPERSPQRDPALAPGVDGRPGADRDADPGPGPARAATGSPHDG